IVGASLFPGNYDMNPLSQLNFDTTRAWNDANHNFVPNCNLANPNANGECGPLANAAFGLPAPLSLTQAPNTVTGWGNRPYEWQMSRFVSQQWLPRVSVDVGYSRTWFGNATVVDNQAATASDYNQFKYTVPTDSTLPGGGGQVLTFTDINPAKFG